MCLVDFHGYAWHEAATLVSQLKERLRKTDKQLSDYVRHNEPFDLACDLSGKALDVDDFAEQYDLILEKLALR